MELEAMQMVASETFNEMLERRRAELGLKQGEAAQRCGFSQSCWSTYEAGGRLPHAVRVPDIATGLGIDEQVVWDVFRRTRKIRRQSS